uniref:NudC domain-containing protein 3 n=1 Tax=Xiphophorus couchianus TaxID=32473 RepID=A0A3B5MV69_9TELE
MASPLEMTEMYDNALLGILQHVGNIQDFLQIYFGFLYRKTDFYRLLSGPNDRMGFPPGAAEKMVLKVNFKRGLSEQRQREASSRAPPAAQEVEVSSELCQATEEKSGAEPSRTESASSDAGQVPAPAASEDSGRSQAASSGPGGEEGQAAANRTAAAAAAANEFQSDPDSYNGAVRENYSWSQDYTDVEVRVFVPKTVVKGRQVSVSLQSGGLRVSVKDGAEERTLMEGEFTHKINTEETLWSLEPGKCVLLSLNKTSEVWWNAVLKGEKEIDINQINRERSMATVDEEEHAVLDRLTFDYHQKQQGKPQSHEMKVHEMLKKGWDAEGSPFRGQEFDPSMFDIPPSAVQF